MCQACSALPLVTGADAKPRLIGERGRGMIFDDDQAESVTEIVPIGFERSDERNGLMLKCFRCSPDSDVAARAAGNS